MREGVAVEELSEGEWGTRRFVSQLCTKNITNVSVLIDFIELKTFH